MKRAKIVLTSIAALGILGGVFAFKAKSSYGATVYYVNKASNATPNATITGQFLAGTTISYYYTTSPSGKTGTTFESFSLVP